MNILLLNQAFYPDIVSTALHLKDLARELARRGHKVTVVASRRAYDDPATRFARHETWEGIEIRRVGATGLGKRRKWHRAADFATFLAACSLKTLTLPRPDVIVALTSPPLIAYWSAWLARLRRGHFVYWVMDFNPDEAIAAGWLAASSWPARLLEACSRFCLRQATRIVALDRFMRDRILAKGVSPERVVVLAPWSFDEEVRFDPVGREAFRARHGLQDKFVVMYSGNHSPCHPLKTLLDAAVAARTDPTLAFFFVGGGSELPKVRQFAAQQQLSNIVCLPYQPMEELPGSLSAADLHVVVMGDPLVGLVHPSKIYNLLHISAPLLYVGPSCSHVTEILADLGDDQLCAGLHHGDVTGVLEHIARVRQAGRRGDPAQFGKIANRFARAVLLPQLVAEIERTGG